MAKNIAKFQSLEISKKFEVKCSRGPYKTPYGDSYTLFISKEGSEETFELYATKKLVSYITENKPSDKFYFTVKERNGMKYPYIEGEYEQKQWNELK